MTDDPFGSIFGARAEKDPFDELFGGPAPKPEPDPGIRRAFGMPEAKPAPTFEDATEPVDTDLPELTPGQAKVRQRRAAREAQADIEANTIRPDGTFEYYSEFLKRGFQSWGSGINRTAGIVLDSLGAAEAAEWQRQKADVRAGRAARTIEGETTGEEVWTNPTPKNIANFMLETGVTSTPEMFAAIASIPAYVAAMAGRTAQARAEGDNEVEAGLFDLVASLPSSVVSAYLDRLPLQAIFGGKLGRNAAGRVVGGIGAEAPTEALQSGVEYAGATLGTEAGFDPQQALKEMVLGGLAGAGMGGGIAGGVEIARGAGAFTRRTREEAAFEDIFGTPEGPSADEAARAALDPTAYAAGENRTGTMGAPVTVRRPEPGKSYGLADAIDELGMTPAEAQEFIATGQDPRPTLEPHAPLSQDDHDSPLPDEDIQAGKDTIADALGEPRDPAKPYYPEDAEPEPAGPVANAKAITEQLFPEATITSSYRGPDHPLSKKNPKSWHAKSRAAVDMAPVPGMTFEQAKQRFTDAGYTLIEAINETGKGRTKHATGDHWHFVLGSGGTGAATPPPGSTLPTDEELAEAAKPPEQTAAERVKEVLGEDIFEPTKGQRVEVTQAGETVAGTVEEIWQDDEGRAGVRIAKDDGTTFDEVLEDAREFGARITAPVERVKEPGQVSRPSEATGADVLARVKRLEPDYQNDKDILAVPKWALREIPVSRIQQEDPDTNPDPYNRVVELDDDVVREYLRGRPSEPVVIDAAGWPLDGNHRVEAARRRGDETILAYVPAEDSSKSVKTVLEDTSEAPAAEFDPEQHVPALKDLVRNTKVNLNDLKAIGRRLGLTPEQANKVMGAVASRPGSGFFMTKGRPARYRTQQMGGGRTRRIKVREGVPPRWQREPVRKKAMSVMEFVRSIGGVKSGRHDLRNVGAIGRYPGVINNKSGRPLDEVGEALWEAGYFIGRTTGDTDTRPTEDETIDLMDRASLNRSVGLEDEAPEADEYGEEATAENVEQRLRGMVEEAGHSLTDDELSDAMRYLASRGVLDEEALQWALHAAMDDAAARSLDLLAEDTGNAYYEQHRDSIYEGEYAEERDRGPEEGLAGPESLEGDEEGSRAPDAEPAEPAESEVAPTSTAPEHATVGVDERELAEVVVEFKDVLESQGVGDGQVTHIFDPPAKGEIVRLAEKSRVYHRDHGWMSLAEAKAKIAEWEAHAVAQGNDPAARSVNGSKVVLSFFDLSGVWSAPWEQAGYDVWRFDIQSDPDMGDVNNFSTEFFSDWFSSFEGKEIHAILAACPCTDFASSGARHFAAKDADGRTVASVRLVQQTLAAIEYFKPAVWALENPVGRIEKLGGLPPWRLSFDPNDIGEPYTKKTLIWGRFNGDLPIAPVEPKEGSKMWARFGGKSLKTKNARSVTPEGFAYAFFMANNAVDHPAMTVANTFDRLDRGLIEQAVEAGVTPEQITEAVEDFYYQDMDDDAANAAIRALTEAATAPVAEPAAPAPTGTPPKLRAFVDEAAGTPEGVAAKAFVDALETGGEWPQWQAAFIIGARGEQQTFAPEEALEKRAYNAGKKWAKEQATPAPAAPPQPAPRGETAAAPGGRAFDLAEFTRIGETHEGHPLFERDDGMRYYLRDGHAFARKVEPFSQAEGSPRTSDFLTTEEYAERERTVRGETAATPTSDYGTKNKVFTADKAEAARKLIRDRLRNQLNAGFDPEVAMAGMQIAGFHIEAGIRKFADLARAVADDLQMELAELKPYLAAWYNGARDLMEGQGLDVDDMDGAGAVRAAVAIIPDASVSPPVGGIGENEGTSDVSGAAAGVESDRAGTPAEDTAGEAAVPDTTGPDVAEAGGSSAGTQTARGGPERSRGLFDDLPPAVGGRGAVGVRNEPPAVPGRPADLREPERSGDRGQPGPANERPGPAAVEGAADGAQTLAAKEAAQRAADSIRVVPGDLDNIRQTLPYLTTQQQEDVHAAEKRLKVGEGMLFTNGTGTGKTFTGGGVVARLVRQGKGNILIIAPSQDIVGDWVKALAKLGVTATPLESTTDRGKGVSITTYANMAGNPELAHRKFDLVVPDESHTLMSAKDAEATKNIAAFRALTNHPRGRAERARRQLHKRWAPFDRIRDEYNSNRRNRGHWTQMLSDRQKDDLEALGRETDELERSFADLPRSKVVFLSATPFAYVKNIEYAEGYLFDYGEDTAKDRMRGYNEPDPREAFFIQHFGYRMRNNKLTQPDAGVDNGVMEREFHEHLKKTGALSGRVLDEDWDYDRKFVLIDDAVGNQIDQALAWLSENRRFAGLSKLIRDQFTYLNRMRLLEAIKAHHAVPIIKEHLALGRKVVVFHDYNQGTGFSPFDITFIDSDGKPTEEREPGHVGLVLSADATTSLLNEDGQVEEYEEIETSMGTVTQAKQVRIADLYAEFVAANPYVKRMDFGKMRNPIETLTAAFPEALVYNGTISKGRRTRAKESFNSDAPDSAKLIIVQAAAGQAGISLHDTTGQHQRVLINLGMPVRPTAAIQEEGRIYRIGQKSNAAFRYFNTGTTWERHTFASVISERASTAENLALGNLARTLKQSFIDAFIEADTYPASPEDGLGGKVRDRGDNTLTPFQRSKTFYWAQQKLKRGRDQRQGVDYFATPEPVGFKMGEWANLKAGEKVLEPSAGHGAIARFLPERADRTLVEPSEELATKAELASPGARIVISRFEDLNVGANKFDGIVMNPPFGVGGKTAFEHVEKAAKHLRNGGRLVALVPQGPAANKRFDAFREAHPDLHLIADVLLPSATFERAGTAVSTHIAVFERHTDKAVAEALPPPDLVDLTGEKDVQGLFDRIENVDLPERTPPLTEDAPDLGTIPERERAFVVAGFTFRLTPEAAKPARFLGGSEFKRLARLAEKYGGRYTSGSGYVFSQAPEPQVARDEFLRAVANGETVEPPAAPAGVAAAPGGAPAVGFDLGETIHGKTGQPVFVATIGSRVERDEYQRINEIARANGGYYSSFRGGNAIPGFQFPTAEARARFVDTVNGRGPLAQVWVEPFYSALERAVEASTTTRARADQWKATLSRTPGVKKEELEWSGLLDWLDLQEGMVEREAVLNALRSGGIQVDERVYGGPVDPDDIEDVLEARIRELIFERRNDLEERGEGPATHFVEEDEGGEGFRVFGERASEIDVFPTEEQANRVAHRMDVEAAQDFEIDIRNNLNSGLLRRIEEEIERDFDEEAATKFARWTSDGTNKTYRELLITLPPGERGNPERTPSTHWGEEGVVAHARFMDKTDADGKRVLFIEEVQSDWHQKGREHGYATAPDTAALAVAEKARDEAQDRYRDASAALEAEARRLTDENPDAAALSDFASPRLWQREAAFRSVVAGRGAEDDAAMALVQEFEAAGLALNESLQAVDRLRSPSGIPNAPFKSSWPALVMKRMIVWAAQNGYDRVAWTTGEEQAERYNLSRAVGTLRVTKQDDGRYAVVPSAVSVARVLYDNDMASEEVIGPNHSRRKVPIMTEEQVRTAFGADLGGRIIDTMNSERNLAVQGEVEFEGDDLRIGGEGMKAFYDRNLVNITNDLIKKYGGKVEQVPVVDGNAQREAERLEDQAARDFASAGREGVSQASADMVREVAQQARDSAVALRRGEPHPGFEITDKMREAALGGLPLFQTGEAFAKWLTPEREAQFTAELVAQMKKLLPNDNIALRVVRTATVYGEKVQGSYWRRIIEVGLNASNRSWTLAHEAVHAMRALGLFTPAEWKILVDAAWHDRPSMQERVRKGWGRFNLSEDRMQEEAVAELFGEHWDLFEIEMGKSLLGRILRRMMSLIVAVARAVAKVRGVPNPQIPAYDIMRRMQRGEIGARPEGFGDWPTDAPIPPVTVRRGGRLVQQAFADPAAQPEDLFEEPAQPERSMTQRQRAELEARQKQSMSRRGDQVGLGDQEGGLFSNERDQGRLFSVAPESAAGWTSERIARLLRKYAVSHDETKTKSYVAWVTPQQFLDVTTPTEQQGAVRERAGALDRDRLRGESQEHFLIVEETEPGIFRTRGHEGRHRMAALAAAGVDRVPVVINRRDIGWRDLEPLRTAILLAQRHGGDFRGAKNIILDGLVPLTFANREQIEREFGQGNMLFSVAAPISPASPEFSDPETEARWKDAKKGIGAGPGVIDKLRQGWNDAVQSFTRHWKHLPQEARFADAGQQLRKLEAAPDAAMQASITYLRNLVGTMDQAEYDLFSRKVVLDDLAWDVSQGRDLPFGFTPETLKAERINIDTQIGLNPKLIEALRSRKTHNSRIANAMVEAGVLTREEIKNPAYFRHMVLDYARAEAKLAATPGSKVKSPYWAKRLGSLKDINANILEAELDWLMKAQVDIATAKTIDWLKTSDHNIRDRLRSEAKASNKTLMDAAIAATPELGAQDAKYRQAMGHGFSIVKKALDDDQVGVIPRHLQSAAAAVQSGSRAGDPPFAFLAWLADHKKPGAMGALMILKAVGQRKAWVADTLGDKYLDPDDLPDLVKKIGPEGYKAWQPIEGRHLFTAKGYTESAIDKFLASVADMPFPGMSKAELKAAIGPVKRQLVLGGDRYTMVLPDEIADTLTEFGDRHAENVAINIYVGLQSAWKRWVLINPRRFLKYNINNMTGDLDAIIAGNPGTLRRVRTAWTMLREAAAGNPSERYTEALERGVFTSGLSVQEIPDINRLSALRHLTEDRGVVNKLTVGAVAKVWRALQDTTNFRESLFRLAAYLDYVEKIERGDEQAKIGYGASVPKMVDAVTDPKDRAALLARDLIGDYGAISVAGAGIRKYLIPFWSWTEINTKRYWRLTGNAFSQSYARGAAVGGLLGAGIAARVAVGLTLRMATVYAALYLWNNLLFGDEEDDLGDLQKRQLHMILGRDSDGEVITLRTQGALSDVLGMFGFPDAVAGYRAYQNGQGTIGQAVKDTLKAPVNRIVTGGTPLITTPLEQMLGKELWPDIFEAREIKDRWRHLFSNVTMEHEYDLLADRPTRGYGRSWTESLVYRRDPGEMAFDTAKGIAYDWLENVKGQSPGGGTSPRSAALRDYRMALRYGDQDAADKALIRYAEFEGTDEGLKTSIRRQHPLGPIAKKDRAAFLDSLTEEQLETFADAEEWYNRIFLGIEPPEEEGAP